MQSYYQPKSLIEGDLAFLGVQMALAAPLCDFLDRFFSLTLLEAIIPVSEPEKKPLKTSSPAREDNKNIKDGFSIIY